MDNSEIDIEEIISSGVKGFKEALPRTTTKVKPFSFDQRDKFLLQKKHDYIEKARGEERKETVFKAHPITSYQNFPHDASSSSSSTLSNHSQDTEDLERDLKSARALAHKTKPFQIHRSEKKLTKVLPFHFATEERFQQRLEFDLNQKKQHEEAMKLFNHQMELKKKEEIKKLRKSLVHKPVPVPTFIKKRNQFMTNDHHSDRDHHNNLNHEEIQHDVTNKKETINNLTKNEENKSNLTKNEEKNNLVKSEENKSNLTKNEEKNNLTNNEENKNHLEDDVMHKTNNAEEFYCINNEEEQEDILTEKAKYNHIINGE